VVRSRRIGDMKTYLVGGAVRDELLGLAVGERDWVVVGATPEAMSEQGYRPVGKGFPVFLHPQTNEEYALARTERKTGHGHQGFTFHADPSVTLEEDLSRRDLTINAMARGDDAVLVDPYGGKADLDGRVLRHVSDAFDEDPLRVLRIARFAARFAGLGFLIADETQARMRAMSSSGELQTLPAERIWQELHKALKTDSPQIFLQVLRDCGALAVLLPEVEALFGVPQPERYHPEIDTGVHTLMCVEQAARLCADAEVRFAVLMHDLGKAATPTDKLPSHHGHDAAGVPLVKAACERLRAPRSFSELAVLTCREHVNLHRADEARPGTLADLLIRCDALRRPERFDQLILACHADLRGRTGFEDIPYPQGDRLRRGLAAIQAVDHSSLDLASGDAERKVRDARIAAVAEAIGDG
jgi:tRNA nucleotidyltransferase (CCA-adding enzyme)